MQMEQALDPASSEASMPAEMQSLAPSQHQAHRARGSESFLYRH
jgi:hypothetical protein